MKESPVLVFSLLLWVVLKFLYIWVVCPWKWRKLEITGGLKKFWYKFSTTFFPACVPCNFSLEGKLWSQKRSIAIFSYKGQKNPPNRSMVCCAVNTSTTGHFSSTTDHLTIQNVWRSIGHMVTITFGPLWVCRYGPLYLPFEDHQEIVMHFLSLYSVSHRDN